MKRQARIKRHLRVRKYLSGTAEHPRLSVFRSSKHIYAQVIDDKIGKTLLFVSDFKMKDKQKSERAYEVGKQLATKALKLKIKKVVFDRGGFLYHGRIENLARGARDGGLEF